MVSLTRFIEGRLKLQVNAQKSAVARPWQRSFLGFTVTDDPQPRRRIADKAVARFKDRVRELTRRHRGVSLERMIADLNPLLRGLIASTRSANQATRAHNFRTYQDIRLGITGAWRSFTAEKDENRLPVAIPNLLNEYEVACFLCNSGIVSKAISEELDNYLINGISILLETPKVNEQIRNLHIGEGAFGGIRRFIETHRRTFKNDPQLNQLVGQWPRGHLSVGTKLLVGLAIVVVIALLGYVALPRRFLTP